MFRWYFILRLQSVAVLMTAAAPVPTMNFTAKLYEFRNSRVFSFRCETNAMFEGCIVNFLKNDKSEQSIKYDNNKCYYISLNGRGICDPDKCACSCCHTFSWNYTVNNDSNMENTSFECEGKIYENQQRFGASFVLQLIQKKFVFPKKNITPYGRRQPIQGLSVINNYTSTITPELKPNDDAVNIRYSILAIVSLIVVMCVVIVAVYIKQSYYRDPIQNEVQGNAGYTFPKEAQGNAGDPIRNEVQGNAGDPIQNEVQGNAGAKTEENTVQAQGNADELMENTNVAEDKTSKTQSETDIDQPRTPANVRDSRLKKELEPLLQETEKEKK